MNTRKKHIWLVAVGLMIIVLIVSGCGRGPLAGVGGDTAMSAPAMEPQVGRDDFYIEEEGDFAAGGFAGDDAGEAFPAEQPMPAADADGVMNTSGGANQNDVQIERLIIRNGYVSVAVEDTIAAEAEVEKLVSSLSQQGAFIVSREQYGGGNNRSPNISMHIRVPVEEFDSAMDQLTELAAPNTVPTRNESGQDVTEEYVDLSARLESLEAARDRLLEIMENAETTEDLLMAEQQLTQREAEIESIKGRMQYLGESARLSSIQIELTPYFVSQPIDNRWRPAETVRRAIEGLINGLQGFADFVIIFVIAVLPWLVAFGLVVYGIVRFVMWRFRIRKEKQALQPAQDET